MSTHNICFHGEIRKISAFFRRKKRLICCYGKGPDQTAQITHADLGLHCHICLKTHFCIAKPKLSFFFFYFITNYVIATN